MTIQLGKVYLIPGDVMKRPGKKKNFIKKVLTWPFLQIEITKINNFALKLKTRPKQLNIYKAD